jgi:hypothetical protein
MPCQYTLDKSKLHLEVVDLSAATVTTVIPVEQCSTVRVELIYTATADAAAQPELFTGSDSGGSDLVEIPNTSFETLSKEAGTTQIRTLEFCPDKEYFQVQWPATQTADCYVVVTQNHCRTNVPYDTTAGNHLAEKVAVRT